jgi:hypothetical protein
MKAIRLITGQEDWYTELGHKSLSEIAKSWFSKPEIQSFIQLNRFEDALWYDRAGFNEFLWWMAVTAYIHCEMKPQCTHNEAAEILLGCYAIIQDLSEADQGSDYKFEKLMDRIQNLDQ